MPSISLTGCPPHHHHHQPPLTTTLLLKRRCCKMPFFFFHTSLWKGCEGWWWEGRGRGYKRVNATRNQKQQLRFFLSSRSALKARAGSTPFIPPTPCNFKDDVFTNHPLTVCKARSCLCSLISSSLFIFFEADDAYGVGASFIRGKHRRSAVGGG